jgi:hypothetical protein
MQKRMRISEAFDPGDFPNIVNSDKLDRITGGEEDIEKVLPNLTNNEQSYLEYLSSERYKELLARLEKQTGKKFKTENSLTPVLMSSMQLAHSVMQKEERHKEFLEHLAVETVLNIPMFKQLKEQHDAGNVIFDVTLGDVNIDLLSDAESFQQQDPDTGLFGDEQAELELADSLDVDGEVLRRKVANMITQGASVSYFDVFRLIGDQLQEKLGPNIENEYALLVTISNIMYWYMPEGVERMSAQMGMAAGAEEIDQDEDGRFVIKAQGLCFPVLIHELIKGAMEVVMSSIHPNKQATKAAMATDTLEGETFDIMIGPALWAKLRSIVTPQDQQYLLWVLQKIMSLPLSPDEKSGLKIGFVDALKSILSSNNQSKALVDKFLAEIKAEIAEYEEGD